VAGAGNQSHYKEPENPASPLSLSSSRKYPMLKDNLIWIGVGLMLFLSVWLGTPTGDKAVKSIGGFFKSLIPKRKKITNDDVSIHEVVESLLTIAEADGDEEGVMLLTAYGKHLYDRREKEADNDD
jgi:hypothetical protein